MLENQQNISNFNVKYVLKRTKAGLGKLDTNVPPAFNLASVYHDPVRMCSALIRHTAKLAG